MASKMGPGSKKRGAPVLVAKTPQEAHKSLPRDVKRPSRDAQERPKTAQEAPKRGPRGSKMVPSGAKMPQDRFKTRQDPPCFGEARKLQIADSFFLLG